MANPHRKQTLITAGLLLLAALVSVVAATPQAGGPVFMGIPVDFILFALTLAGVALLHERTTERE